jgi:hypothetical protein
MSENHRGMQAKTIRKILRSKLEDWLASITDQSLVGDIKRDVIVTGGSITSMLLGEKVNDYDVYFKTKETTKKVAEYYVSKFNSINNTKGLCTRDWTPEVREATIANCKGEREERIIIFIQSAGVVSESQEDYKYFELYDPDLTSEFADSLVENVKEGEKYRTLFMSQNAITLSDSMQIVIRFFGKPEQIHDNYDFAHAMCYYDYNSNHLELKAEAMECMLSRTLMYRGSLYPIASIFRMKKFVERGWKINAGQQLKIMWQINELNLKDPQQLYEQLTGVDMAYMYQLISAIKGIDPKRLNQAYIAEIIDRIFG